MPPITFIINDFKAIDSMQDDPMVISVEIANYIVKKNLIDQGSSADILFWKTFKQLYIPEFEILPHDDPLFGWGIGRDKGLHLALHQVRTWGATIEKVKDTIHDSGCSHVVQHIPRSPLTQCP